MITAKVTGLTEALSVVKQKSAIREAALNKN